jgi:hypothetical protein
MNQAARMSNVMTVGPRSGLTLVPTLVEQVFLGSQLELQEGLQSSPRNAPSLAGAQGSRHIPRVL